MLARETYADILRPDSKSLAEVYDIVLIVGGSLFIGLCAQVAFGWPVPVTGQTFAVLLIGALFGARRGSLCLCAYIIEGLAGLPVFAHGKSGLAALSGPTGGYIVGFIAAAWVTGFLAQRKWDRRFGTTVLAMVLGNICIYVFGIFWLSRLTGIVQALSVGLYPFIFGDILKVLLSAAILPAGWKLLAIKHPAKQHF